MAVSDRYTGSAVVIEFLPAGGTAPADIETLSGDFTSFSYDQSTDVVDITAGNEKERAMIQTITALEWSISAFDTQAGFDKSVVYAGAQGTLTVYPKGKVNGEEYFAFNTVINGLNVSAPFDGAVEIEISGVRNGANTVAFGSSYTTP